MIHGGDLVNRANSDRQWDEWFKAGGWIFAMVPSMPVAGNHEYKKGPDFEVNGKDKNIDSIVFWEGYFYFFMEREKLK